jgi:hypothetical protein
MYASLLFISCTVPTDKYNKCNWTREFTRRSPLKKLERRSCIAAPRLGRSFVRSFAVADGPHPFVPYIGLEVDGMSAVVVIVAVVVVVVGLPRPARSTLLHMLVVDELLPTFRRPTKVERVIERIRSCQSGSRTTRSLFVSLIMCARSLSLLRRREGTCQGTSNAKRGVSIGALPKREKKGRRGRSMNNARRNAATLRFYCVTPAVRSFLPSNPSTTAASRFYSLTSALADVSQKIYCTLRSE